MKTSYPTQWLAGVASLFAPLWVRPEPKRILFTSFHGDGYRGNTRVLYEALQDHPFLEPVWLSRNRTLVRTLQQRYGASRAFNMHSLEGVRQLASASMILFTHGTSDYPFLRLPRRAIRVQTYHGLPTKRGEYLRPHHDRPPGWLHRTVLNYRFSPIDYFLSSSPTTTRLFSKRFAIPPERFVETGYPAYDRLLKGCPDERRLGDLTSSIPSGDFVLLYAPTFRRRSQTRWFPFGDMDPVALAEFLEHRKGLLLLRPHPNDNVDLSLYLNASPRILYAGQDRVEDLTGLLLRADAVLTDYSGIYLEALLCGIPSIFVPYDREVYERGFILPYDDMTPGDKVQSFRELTDSLTRIMEGRYGYEAEMERVKKIFFDRPDGAATARVIEWIEVQISNGDEVRAESSKE